MNSLVKTAVLTAALAATVAAPMSEAWAGHRIRHDRHPVVHRGPVNGDLVAAGILGIAIGAIIVGAANSGGPVIEPRPRPHWDRYPDAPRVVTFDDDSWSPEPWSQEWFEECDARYNTFNPKTGTYVAKGGKRKFCTLD